MTVLLFKKENWFLNFIPDLLNKISEAILATVYPKPAGESDTYMLKVSYHMCFLCVCHKFQ